MKKFGTLLCVLTLAVPAFAQTAAPTSKPAATAATVTVPLSTTEQVAIGAFAEKLQANQKAHDELIDSLPHSVAVKLQANQQERDALLAAIHQVELEIIIEHPGHHFDEQTGKIVKDPPPPAPAAAPVKPTK